MSHPFRRLARHFLVIGSLSSLFLLPGCALLLGNVKPVDEKSRSYGVADLAKEKPAIWKRLSPEKSADDKEDAQNPTEVSDVAYQAVETAAIISLNSACRTGTDPDAEDRRDLQTMTNLLFLGISDVTQRTEQGILVSQVIPALETTLQGKLNGEVMKLRTVVFRKSSCVYDMIYMSRPANFERHESDFAHFVASLRLR